jgi:hypothetical protein
VFSDASFLQVTGSTESETMDKKNYCMQIILHNIPVRLYQCSFKISKKVTAFTNCVIIWKELFMLS